MGLLAKDTGGSGDYQPLAADTYISRLIRVVDLGKQSMPVWGKKGEFEDKHRVLLMFEIPSELIKLKDSDQEMPMVFSKEFTLSLHPKSELRPMLESLRRSAYTDEQAATGVDLSQVVGVPASIGIIHKESKGKMYANIGSIRALAKGVNCPGACHTCFAYSIEDGRDENFGELPEWIQKKIMASSDWAGKEGAEFEGISAEEQKKMDNLAHPQETPPPDDSDYNGNEIADEDLPF